MTLPAKLKHSCNKNLQNNCSKNEQKDSIYECNVCGKRFYRKASLTVHVNSHKFNISLDEKPEKDAQNICSICFKKFTAKKNLLKHLRYVHKNYSEAAQMLIKKIKCPEKDCDFLCRMMKELRDHIEKSHNIKILKDTLQFTSETAFQKWKKEEECNTISWFVTGRKKTTLIDGTKKQILHCHRSGHYSPKGFGKYRMRSVGTCKIGVTCPAAMEVIESPEGELNVIYYKTHLGHMQDLVYLKLSREERMNIAEKIKQGFSFDAILEDIKESQYLDTEKKKRIHLLSKKDLYSIMRTVNCENVKNFKKNPEESARENGSETKEGETLDLEQIQPGKIKEGMKQSFTLYSPHIIISSHEKEKDVKENPHIVTHQKYQKDVITPQTSREGIASQIVILSPEVDCTSFAEIILLSAGDGNIPQSTISPQTKVSIVENSSPSKADSQSNTNSNLTTEEGNKPKSNLHLQLKEKIEKISELLPQSQYLTPKQFNLVNTKLNAILDIFNLVNMKATAKKQNMKRNFIKKGKNFRSEKINDEIEYKAEDTLGQEVYDSSLMYAICS